MQRRGATHILPGAGNQRRSADMCVSLRLSGIQIPALARADPAQLLKQAGSAAQR